MHKSGRKSKLETPHIKAQVVKRLAVGEPQEAIAKDFGIHQSQVSRFASREDIRAAIDDAQKQLLECIPDAVENIKNLVREMKHIPKNENKRRELSYKASSDVLKGAGLFPTSVQSQTFINLCQQNTTILSPVILRLLEAQRREMEAFLESEEADKDSKNEIWCI